MTDVTQEKDNLIELTADIVSAYVTKNNVAQSELSKLIKEVHQALAGISPGAAGKADLTPAKPAVPIKKSIFPDYLICLEDGKKFKSLKRHLRSHYNISPEQYREKWGLPADYPMVAPSYAKTRSRLARTMGLGKRRGK